MTLTDPVLETLVFAAIALCGMIVVYIGRTQPTAEEEEWKNNWRRWIFNPPGYNRATTIVMGFLLTIAGTIGVIVEAVRSLTE